MKLYLITLFYLFSFCLCDDDYSKIYVVRRGLKAMNKTLPMIGKFSHSGILIKDAYHRNLYKLIEYMNDG